MNRTRMVASSISTILRLTLPSTLRCISFVPSNSQTLLQRQPTFSSSLEHSSSVLQISGKISPLKLQLSSRSFCSKSGDETNSKCWNCDASLEKMPCVFCHSCGNVQPVDELHDFDWFQFYGLERKYDIDISSLEEKYDDLRNRLLTVEDQTKSEEESDYIHDQLTKANLAYRYLKRPWERAEQLMRLNGIDVELYEHCWDSLELPNEIMEIREAVKEANDLKALDEIQSQVKEKLKLWSDLFDKAIKNQKFDEAEICIPSLMGYERVDDEIEGKKYELCPKAKLVS